MLGTLNPNPTIRKRFLWTFNIIERTQSEEIEHEAFFVKLQHRPFEDQELEFLNGKPRVDLSFIKDEEARKKLEKQVFVMHFTSDAKSTQDFYNFLAEYFNFGYGQDGKLKEDYPLWGEGKWGGVLTLYDGCGNPLERWTMKDIRPLSIVFTDIDYSSSEDTGIEATIMYSEAHLKCLTIKEATPGNEANHKCLEERLKETFRQLRK